MIENDEYMSDFMGLFTQVDRWGPGCEQDTARAISVLPIAPRKALDIGCGKGYATLSLANYTTAQITALDNEPSALECLSKKLRKEGWDTRVKVCCKSMTDLDFKDEEFDLIWCEASVYIIGFNRALTEWRHLLSNNGCLVVSDLVWRVNKPSSECINFWEKEYPDMRTLKTRLDYTRSAGYRLVDHFSLSQMAFENYYNPVAKVLYQQLQENPQSQALKDILCEVNIYKKYYGEFGYEFFVLSKG